MRGPAGRFRQFCLIVAACVLFGYGSLALHEARMLQKTISLACVEAEVTGAQLAQIRLAEAEKESRTVFTAWTEQSGEMVCQPDGSRPVRTRVLAINGSSDLLIPRGKILKEDDLEGCLLGCETAEKLFGSRNVSGLTLCYGERELTIRGVLEEPGDLLVVVAGDADTFRRITLRSDEPFAAGLVAERFLQNYGLFARQIRYDLFGGEYLQSLIPGRWSDFDGWKRSFDKVGEDVRFLVSVEKGCLETGYLACRLRASAGILAGALLLAAAFLAQPAFCGKKNKKSCTFSQKAL